MPSTRNSRSDPVGDSRAAVRREKETARERGAIASGDTALAERLRDRGQRATTQRLVLHRVLRELDRHVSAEEVQRAAQERLPTVSLPTVYATLELFDQLGLVRRVAAPSSAALYDPRTDEHTHLVCRRCGRVEDLDAALDDRPALAAARGAGFAAERAETTVTGVCRACVG